MDKDFIKKIESGEIKMTSKYYFLLRDFLVILVAAIIFLLSIFLVSMVFFEVRESGAAVLPKFGTPGFKIFIAIFPWIPILLALGLTFILSLVLKRYSFAYRKPLLYVPIIIAVILLFVSSIVQVGKVHQKIRDLSREGSAPAFIGGFYPKGSLGDDKVLLGKVTSETPNMIYMQSDDDSYTVIISNQTQFPYGNDFLPDENIAVIGERRGDTINAIAIRRLIQKNTNPPPPGLFLFEPNQDNK